MRFVSIMMVSLIIALCMRLFCIYYLLAIRYTSRHGVQGTPRTVFCIVLAALTATWLLALVLTIAAAGSSYALLPLPIITVAAGFTFGGYWTLMTATTSELFGLKYFSANYATVQIAPILATCLCPNVLVGSLYDVIARRQNPAADGGDLPCFGRQCFLPAFLILFGISFLVLSHSPLKECHHALQHRCGSAYAYAISLGELDVPANCPQIDAVGCTTVDCISKLIVCDCPLTRDVSG
jgi:hypothetical protein